MTIGLQRRNDAIGNDSTDTYPYGFKIFAATDLEVKVKRTSDGSITALTYPTHYDVTNVGKAAGGNVVLANVGGAWQNSDGTLKTGYTIASVRDVPQTQAADIRNQGGFFADTHEDEFDKLTMLIQRLSDDVDRSAKLDSAYDTDDFDMTLPAPVAGAAIGYNADADGLALITTLTGTATTAFTQSLLDDANTEAFLDTLTASLSAETSPAIDDRLILSDVSAGTWDYIELQHALKVINGLTAETDPDRDNDKFPVYDASSGTVKTISPKMTKVAVAVRQCVLSSALDASGYAASLTTGSGLRPGLDASPTPLVVTFASGFDEYGSVDYATKISADASDLLGADLKTSNTAYIAATYTSPVAVTWAAHYIPPQEGETFDRTQGALLNFEGSNGATTTTDDVGNSVALTSATISTTQFKFGTSSLRLGGAAHRAAIASITSVGDGSWEISAWARPDTAITGAAQAIVFAVNAGGFGIQLFIDATGHIGANLSSNGTSNDIVSTSGATVLSNATWYKVRLVFDALGGTYRVYLSNNGAAETQEINQSSSARICQFSGGILIGSATIAMIGYVDAFRFIRAATATATETPSGSAPAIIDYPVHFFSIPEMKMYEVTAASVTAGVNPTLTECKRVFVGEADTSGVAVTAVRSYALRGKYVQAWFALPALATVSNYSHNIGTTNHRSRLQLRSKISQNGWQPGDIAEGVMYSDASQGAPPTIRQGRVSNRWITGSAAAIMAIQSLATGTTASASANWDVRAISERSW